MSVFSIWWASVQEPAPDFGIVCIVIGLLCFSIISMYFVGKASIGTFFRKGGRSERFRSITLLPAVNNDYEYLVIYDEAGDIAQVNVVKTETRNE